MSTKLQAWSRYVNHVQEHYPDRDVYLLDSGTPSVIADFLRCQCEIARSDPKKLAVLPTVIRSYITVITEKYSDHHKTSGRYTRNANGTWTGVPTASHTVHAFMAQVWNKPPVADPKQAVKIEPSTEQKQQSDVKPLEMSAKSDAIDGFFVPNSTRSDVRYWIKYCKFLQQRRPGVGPLELDEETPQFISDFLVWACSDKKSRDENGKLYGCLGMSPTSGRSLTSAIQQQILAYYNDPAQYYQKTDGTYAGDPTRSSEVNETLLYLKYGKAYLSPNTRQSRNQPTELVDYRADLVQLNDKELDGSYWDVESKQRGLDKRKSKEVSKVEVLEIAAPKSETWDLFCLFVEDVYPKRNPFIMDEQTPAIIVKFLSLQAERDKASFHQLCTMRTSLRKQFEFKYKTTEIYKQLRNGKWFGIPTRSPEVKQFMDDFKSARLSVSRSVESVEPDFEIIEPVEPKKEILHSSDILKRIANKHLNQYTIPKKIKRYSSSDHQISERFRQAFQRLPNSGLSISVDLVYYTGCLISFLGLISLDEIVEIRRSSVHIIGNLVKLVLQTGRIIYFETNPLDPHLCIVSLLKLIIVDGKVTVYLVSDDQVSQSSAQGVLQNMLLYFDVDQPDPQFFQKLGVKYYRYVEQFSVQQIATLAHGLSAAEVAKLLE